MKLNSYYINTFKEECCRSKVKEYTIPLSIFLFLYLQRSVSNIARLVADYIQQGL